MEEIFLKILNMGITASWLIVVVLIVHLFLKKVPKSIHCIFWGMVAFKLVCPFSFESAFSMIPSDEPITPDILYKEIVLKTQNEEPLFLWDEIVLVDGMPSDSIITYKTKQIKPVVFCLSIVWMIGMAVMFLFYIVSYLRISHQVRYSIRLKENVWLCDTVETPFILGIFRPQIYVPSNLTQQQMGHVVAHEEAHIKRRDNLWKPLGFLILTVYWFHPLVWISYILFCREMELACDERVVKNMEIGEKKAYSETLLFCSISRDSIRVGSLAFSELGVKMRIKSVLNYKKPSFKVILIAMLLCIVVLVGFTTNQKDENAFSDLFNDMNKVTITYWEHIPSGSGIDTVNERFESDTKTVRLEDYPEKQEQIKQIFEKYYYYVNAPKKINARLILKEPSGIIINYGNTSEEFLSVWLSDAWSINEVDIYCENPNYTYDSTYKIKGKNSVVNMIQELNAVLKEDK